MTCSLLMHLQGHLLSNLDSKTTFISLTTHNFRVGLNKLINWIWCWWGGPTLMSVLKLLIFCQPAFSRWKLAQRNSSSSGDSFIRSSRVSPSLSSAARAVDRRQWSCERQYDRPRGASDGDTDTNMWYVKDASAFFLYLRFCWARCRQTVRSLWSARGGPAPDEASLLSGPRHQYSLNGSQ